MTRRKKQHQSPHIPLTPSHAHPQNTLPPAVNHTLRVAALPLDVVWGDVKSNLDAAEKLLQLLPPHTDVAVLPELFTTGFIADTAVMADAAEPLNGPTLQAVRAWSRQYNLMIAGSFLFSPDLLTPAPHFFNRGFMVAPDGSECFYDKHHLFCLSLESKVFTPGSTPLPVLSFRGWNLSMVVCYDLRFPCWCRNVNHRYDLLLVPANWPHSRGYAWKHLLIARAIENQAPIVGANRSGTDNFGSYDNLSYIFDAIGQPAHPADAAPPPCPPIVFADLDLQEVLHLRQFLPVGRDADPFTIT